MVHKGSHVQILTYSMAAKLFIHFVTVTLSIVFDQFTDLAELNTGLTVLNCHEHRFTSDSRKSLDVCINFSLFIFQEYHG